MYLFARLCHCNVTGTNDRNSDSGQPTQVDTSAAREDTYSFRYLHTVIPLVNEAGQHPGLFTVFTFRKTEQV